jgi:hypothetical protein
METLPFFSQCLKRLVHHIKNRHTKTYNGEKTTSSTNVAGKTGYLPAEN